jgi:hypothetical protein
MHDQHTCENQRAYIMDSSMCLFSLPLICEYFLLQDEGDESGSGEEEDPKLQKRLEKTRNRAAAHVRGGGRSRNSRNASKDKGGRRSKHVSSSSGYEI